MKTVQSTVKPESIEIDDYSVWIAENIREITVVDEEGKEHIEYEYELTQKDKDDYILDIHNAQEQNKTEMELAIVDLANAFITGGLA